MSGIPQGQAATYVVADPAALKAMRKGEPGWGTQDDG